jgi:hypothetical protein
MFCPESMSRELYMQMNHFQTSVISEYGSERNGLTVFVTECKTDKNIQTEPSLLL